VALDELLKGLGAFQQGMTQYGVGQGIQQAKAQVDEINAMQMKEMEKRQALQQVSNNLMATLSQTGADPATIQQAAMPFVQKDLKNSQDFLALGMEKGDKDVTAMGQQLQQQEHAVQTGENQKNRNLQWSMQGRALDAQKDIANIKADVRLQDHEYKAVEKANTLFEEKNRPQFESRAKAQAALSILNSKNPVGDKAVLNLLVKMTGDTGAITDSDRAGFAGSPQLFDQMRRAWEQKIASGNLDEKSRGELIKLATLMKQRKEEEIQGNAQRMASGLSKRLGLPAEQLQDKVFPGFDTMDAPAAPGTAAAAPPAGPQLPPGIPPGSKEAVNARGEKGFLAPDGKTFYKKKAASGAAAGGI
jgi:hypothetical protein